MDGILSTLHTDQKLAVDRLQLIYVHAALVLLKTCLGGPKLQSPKELSWRFQTTVYSARFSMLWSSTSSPVWWTVAHGSNEHLQHISIWGPVDQGQPRCIQVVWVRSASTLASSAGTLFLKSLTSPEYPGSRWRYRHVIEALVFHIWRISWWTTPRRLPESLGLHSR